MAKQLKLRVLLENKIKGKNGICVGYKNETVVCLTVEDAQKASTLPGAHRVEQFKRGEWHDVGATGSLVLL
jgi:hypothetical protein